MHVYCSKNHANKEGNRFCTQCGEPLPLAPEQVVDNRYRIIRHLGQGGFGRTYVAEDLKQSPQQCVLKEFAPQVEEKQDLQKAKELFEREASVLKQLQHPQIPRFHESLQVKLGNKDFFLLVQDYVEGDNYWDLLQERNEQGQSFSEEEVVKLLQQLLPVLSYIHSRNVIHRDISPDNLILRRTDRMPVLIDFGGVKQLPASKGFWFTQLSGNHTILGKKGYAPEEQLRQGKAFPCSDLYSLAVTALVLLTGKEPQQLYDTYEGNWRWGTDIQVSPKLEAVLKIMLAYKPSDRYQKADEVLKNLQLYAPAKPTSTHQTTKIKTMVVAPGRKPIRTLVTNFHNRTQAIAQTLPLPAWLRPFAISLVGTSVVLLTFAGTWALVNAVIAAVSSITIPSISLPKLPDGSKPASNPSSNNEGNRINAIVSRRQQLGISDAYFTPTIDKIFYTKHPEARGRALTNQPEDAALRNNWYRIAEDLLDKLERAELSTSARNKLGKYTGTDYQNWRRQAESGQLGDYSIEQLTTDTNKKFDRLFPGLRRGQEKLETQTYGQIWYAIAADRVSKLESAN
ncbi:MULTISPECIES: serine/threonine-protein kinase [Nostocales]|uniref:non-specific serine/threonine protein kinase n=3 Tax=Nostocales TaxID=1161 RepID=A0A0C1R2H5_9CYAN|nr:serine/threonine-protein kinase [Tolypothrix bouteillei]KAF3885913.1 serine/threonine protein kinase [Tolypothrix bouteillei VB521301]